MAPPNKSGKPKGKKQTQQQTKKPVNKKRPEKEQTLQRHNERKEEEGIDFLTASNSISSDAQQLLLNIFKYALFFNTPPASDSSASSEVKDADGEDKDLLHSQIQTMKTHLYNRDFESAFADASPSLLRAYALRWSASRCLAYAGLFKGAVQCILDSSSEDKDEDKDEELGVLCIGGGAGAEVVALAGAWRVIEDEYLLKGEALIRDSKGGPTERGDGGEEIGIGNLSLTGNDEQEMEKNANSSRKKKRLAITAVDIAEWSDVIQRLNDGIHSSNIPGCKTCTSPLIHGNNHAIDISFQHLDILSLSNEDLKSLLSHTLQAPSSAANKERKTHLISLMFTLNELFSTSISKTTQLLLRLTDLSSPGTILLVVDSPGSYSTLSFCNSESSESSGKQKQQQQRQYPMKFLLDHTLLTVAEGSWEKIISQDSRWFRRDVNSKLHYNVDLEGGQGFIKLEDMRFQIHVYRRLISASSDTK